MVHVAKISCGECAGGGVAGCAVWGDDGVGADSDESDDDDDDASFYEADEDDDEAGLEQHGWGERGEAERGCR